MRSWFDSLAHRVLYTLLFALLALAILLLVGPAIRKYSGTDDQILGEAVVLVLLIELVGGRLHRFVDWLLYGQRGNAAAVSTRLAEELEAVPDSAAGAALVEALAETLRLSHVSALVGPDDDRHVIATVGSEPKAPSRFVIRHGGRELGELRAARRGEPLNHQDESMLRAAAAQLGMVLNAASLTVELQHARERLVSSREDERRRLRRELHDGVGPTLAGIALGLESANRAVVTHPERTADLIAEIRGDVVDLISDVRRVVDGLRPPMLDDVGLAGSLIELGNVFRSRSDCTVEVIAADLPNLPAAAEVAAYRIGAEALTNVFKHAHATSCEVALDVCNGFLVLQIVDDGVGGAAARDGGSGLPSITERAAELGGEVEIISTTAGTRVRARLPLDPVVAGA